MKALAVVGSRGFEPLELVREFISKLRPTTMVVSGGARGVDQTAEEVARRLGLTVVVHVADWKKHGKAAGPIRNEAMIDTVDGLVAFWDGQSRGTAHAVDCARKRGIWLRVYDQSGNIVEESVPK